MTALQASLIGQGLGHSFGEGQIFSQVDIAVRSGGALGLIGPSGSGKTTLLQILGGLLDPAQGRTFLKEGENLARRPYSWSKISWVFQGSNSFRWRTALDNVLVGLVAVRPSEIHAENESAVNSAMDLLQAVGISDKATAVAGRLSGGELQRVGIARALIAKPRFVLADEPTSSLDLATTRQVADLLIETTLARGTGLVLCSHDPEVASRCQTVVELS